MKKLLLSILLMTIVVDYNSAQELITTAPAQEVITTVSAKDTINKSTVLLKYTPVSHWSIGIKGGINYFRIAPETVISRLDQIHLIVAGIVEYSINPLVGLGLEYMYNPFGRRYSINEIPKGDIAGGTHDIILYGSVNLANLLTKYRTGFGSKLNVYGEAGIGYAIYNNSFDGSPTITDLSPMGKIGLNVEYNLSKSLALGIEEQYRFYHRKLVSSTKPDKSNALTTTIGLRYKFNAKGSRQHARNISMSEYYPSRDTIVVEKNVKNTLIEKIAKDDTNETLDRLKALEAQNIALEAKINKLNDEINALSTKQEVAVLAYFQNVKFKFGSDKLTKSSHSVLDQIALVLKNNPGRIRLSVAGYTDYIGTAEYNQVLSVKRADAVKNYLLNKNVPESSISIIGYGEDRPIAPNETIQGRRENRRVEFQFTK
ncbi:MAG: OmpA family protein [Bacteroidota bacterium]|nr:OmpA family protein [Bacteroidota bacterium]